MNKTIRQRFAIPFAYDVTFTRDAFAAGNPALADAFAPFPEGRPHRVLFAVEQAVAEAFPRLLEAIADYAEAWPDVFTLAGPPATLPGGEECKCLARVESLCALMDARRLCRHSFLAAVGGGAFLDMAGFAAAIAHRGTRHIRLPTTVLAQNDSGVGVKNGVNMAGKKNLLGAFAPPAAVLCDLDFLDSLPYREWVGGCPEAFKVAMIKDAEFFHWLCANAHILARRSRSAMEELVTRCAAIHAAHIAGGGDPFESGSARPLDFGHWAAHKLESLSGGALRHGEAVAVGLLLDSLYAVRSGLLPASDFDRLAGAFRTLGLPLWTPELETSAPGGGRPALLDGLDEFREHLGGALRVTLPDGLGRRVELASLDPALILSCAAALKELAASRPIPSV